MDAEFLELIYGPGHYGNNEVSSYLKFQRKHKIACLVFGLTSLLCIVLRLTWIPQLQEAVRLTFDVRSLYYAHFSTACLLGFCSAALFPSIFSLLADIHIRNPRIRRLLFVLGLFFLLLQVLYIMQTFYYPAHISIGFLYQWIPVRILLFCFFSYPVTPFLSGLCIGWWRA